MYVLRLNELFNTTGITRNREKVLKLWETLRPDIQGGLYRANLNPETATYKRLVQKAERIEMILSIEENARRQNREQKTRDAPSRDEKRKQGFRPSSNSKPNVAGTSQRNTKPVAPSFASSSKSKPYGKDHQPNKNTKRRELTPQQKAEYREQGRCFGCGETGHVAHACPKGKVVSGFGNKPPRIQTASAKVKAKKNIRPDPKSARDDGHDDIWSNTINISNLQVNEESSQDPPDLFKALFETGIDLDLGLGSFLRDSHQSDSDDSMPPLDPVTDDEDEGLPPLIWGSDSEGSDSEEMDPAPLESPYTDTDSLDEPPPLIDISELPDSESDSDEDWSSDEWDGSPNLPPPTGPVPQKMRPYRRVGDEPRCANCGRECTLRRSLYDPEGPGYHTMCECEFPTFGKGHLLFHCSDGKSQEKPVRLPPTRIGEFWGHGIEFVLSRMAPYPGETLSRRKIKERVITTQCSGDFYVVSDHLYDREVLLPLTDAKNPEFALVEWYARERARDNNLDFDTLPNQYEWVTTGWNSYACLGELEEDTVEAFLNMHAPWLGLGLKKYNRLLERFDVLESYAADSLDITDNELDVQVFLPRERLTHPRFDLASWYERKLMKYNKTYWELWSLDDDPVLGYLNWEINDEPGYEAMCNVQMYPELWDMDMDDPDLYQYLEEINEMDFRVAGAQIPRGKLPAIQRNASRIKTTGRRVPRPVIIAVRINGQPARALIDTGSMADMISTTLLDQLKLKKVELTNPLPLQLAVQGSRSKINWGTRARLQYQGIDEERYFDVANLSGYDLILGTPWLYQHQVCVGFNDPKVVIGSQPSLPIRDGPWIAEVVTNAAKLEDEAQIEAARKEIIEFARPLFKKASETPLPPLWAINHTIPLIDESKIYPCRPAKCPEKFRDQWAEKRDGYLKTGRWKVKATSNASPMMILPKIDDPTRIR